MTQPTLAQAARVFWRIGLLSFGGPAAQIALMHRELVERRPWLSEAQFLNALSFCMLLPGPEAMQLATYAGWRMHGVRGGLMAGLFFVLPGAAVVLGLSAVYAIYGQVPFIAALFLGVKAAIVVIVVEALLRVARKALNGPLHWALAAFSFIGIFFFDLPFPLIIAVAGLIGFLTRNDHTHATVDKIGFRPIRTAALWLFIWWAPVALLWLSGAEFLTRIALFFSKLAVVTFGGAYAVLAYMTQAAVADHGWLSTAQMMDGLGLAETTPGPLILVTEFVAFMAGFGQQGLGLAAAAALVALWVTFTPCFMWIFTGAPYVEWIAAQPRLRGALSAITAAVVGVILNLSLWFALHVFFKQLTQIEYGPLTVLRPDLGSVDWRVLGLAVLAGFLIIGRKWGLLPVLAVSAIGGAVLSGL